MNKRLEHSYLDIVTIFIVAFTIIAGGAIFLIQDAINIGRDKYRLMSALERIDYYNEKVDDKYIDRFLALLGGKNILDAGCGVGEDCKYLEKKGLMLLG